MPITAVALLALVACADAAAPGAFTAQGAVVGGMLGGGREYTRGLLTGQPLPGLGAAGGAVLGAAVGGPIGREVAVAALLPVDSQPRGDDGVFGLVLAARGQRAEALCTATLERLDLVDLEQGARQRYVRRPVFWMVTQTAGEVAALRDVSCQELAQKLDGQRAQAHGLGAAVGPVLLGYGQRGEKIWRMTWDLSAIPVSEFPRATRIWTELLTSDPAEWEVRSLNVRWREAARAFLIRFGEPLDGLVGAKPSRAEPAAGAPRYIILR
jgi:hypothetical protein